MSAFPLEEVTDLGTEADVREQRLSTFVPSSSKHRSAELIINPNVRRRSTASTDSGSEEGEVTDIAHCCPDESPEIEKEKEVVNVDTDPSAPPNCEVVVQSPNTASLQTERDEITDVEN